MDTPLAEDTPDDFEWAVNWQHCETPMRVYDEDGESYELLMMFHVDQDIPDDEVKQWVEDNFAPTYCQHSYDCCGKYYADRGYHWRVPYSNRVVVHQTFRCNI